MFGALPRNFRFISGLSRALYIRALCRMMGKLQLIERNEPIPLFAASVGLHRIKPPALNTRQIRERSSRAIRRNITRACACSALLNHFGIRYRYIFLLPPQRENIFCWGLRIYSCFSSSCSKNTLNITYSRHCDFFFRFTNETLRNFKSRVCSIFLFREVDFFAVQYLRDSAYCVRSINLDKKTWQKGQSCVSFLLVGKESDFSSSRNFRVRLDWPKMVFNPFSRLRFARVVCVAFVGIPLFRPNPMNFGVLVR